jgi:hypothetical protein
MEKTINERFIKVSSRIPFPKDIQLGDDLTLVINNQSYIVNCVKTEDMDNQDDSINRIYTLKYLGE